ncbi:MAG TPA: hypothetical protein VGJ96_01490 [Gemmatimonadaceae bacterium]|jgi:hypothetical protein
MHASRLLRASLVACALLTLAACARRRATLAPTPRAPAEPVRVMGPVGDGPCADCGPRVADDEVMRAVATRVADLKARGGSCQAYAEVLAVSLAAQRIVVHPFMWRVGPFLASAQAKSTGEIDVAREVDALNIGRRSLDEVVHSVEHEAAHIAFAIPSGAPFNEALVDERVRECRGTATRDGAG